MNWGMPTDRAASRPRQSNTVALRSLLWFRIGVVAVRDTYVAISKQMVSIAPRTTSAVTGSTVVPLSRPRLPASCTRSTFIRSPRGAHRNLTPVSRLS
jgi:hypothetical protein